MKLVLAFVLVVVCLALPVSALDPVVVEPAAPNTQTPVTLYVTAGACGLFEGPVVSVTDSVIDVNMRLGPFFCSPLPVPSTFPVHLGILPSGDYNLIVRSDEAILETMRVVVRNESSLRVRPWSDTVVGGRQIRVESDTAICRDCRGLTMEFGSRAVGAVAESPFVVYTGAPAQGPGLVDITIRVPNENKVLRIEDAFIYHEASSPSPLIHERVLFPTSYTGPGALGAQWVTEASIHNNNRDELRARHGLGFIVACPVDGPCVEDLPGGETGIVRLPSNQPEGHVVHVPRDAVDGLDFSLRVRDAARQRAGFGTEVPVVREGDFIAREFSLLDVPSDTRYRLTLRAYALDPQIDGAFIRIFSTVDVDALVDDAIELRPLAGGIASASVSLLEKYPQLRDKGPLRIEFRSTGVRKLQWAFVSITNNETQQVTVVSPQ